MLSNIPRMNVISFLFHMQFFAAVTVPFFTEWGGLTFQETLLLQSWFVLCWAAFEVPTGAFADRFGRKKSIILGCFTVAAGAFIYGSIPDIRAFVLAEALWALGNAFISGADEAIIYDTLKTFRMQARSKKVFARYSMTLPLAFVIASPLGSIIASKYGLNYPMLFSGIPMIFAGLLALTLKEPAHGRRAQHKKSYISLIIDCASYIRKHPKLRPLVIDSVIGGVLLYYILWFYQVMLKNAGASIDSYGWVSAGMNIFSMVLLARLLQIEKILGKKNLIRATIIIPGIAFVWGAYTKNLALTLVLVFAIMGARALRGPLFSSYFNIHIESGRRATMLSAISMMGRISAALTNVAVGALMDWSVGGTMVAIGLAAVALAIFSGVSESHLE